MPGLACKARRRGIAVAEYTVPQLRRHSSVDAFRPASLFVVTIAIAILPPRALLAERLGALGAAPQLRNGAQGEEAERSRSGFGAARMPRLLRDRALGA